MRTSLLVRSSALLAVAGLALAGCSGDDTEKVASAVTTEATDDATATPDAETDTDTGDEPTDEPSGEASAEPSDDATDDDSAGGTSVGGTQVVELTGTGTELTLEIPEGWQPSDAAGDVPEIVFVAVDPEPYEAFSSNVVVTVEPLPSGLTAEEVFATHDAAGLGYDSEIPDGTDGTTDGYPSHVVSGRLAGPSGEQLAQSSTVVVVEGDDGTGVVLALALTTHADDSEGRSTLGAILEGATID